MLSKKEYNKRYYKDNIEYSRKRVRDYYQKHKKERCAYNKSYYAKNREKLSNYGKKDNNLYSIFYGMYSRCNYSYHKAYKNYGGKGIKIEWNNYQDFNNDMYESYLSHIEKFGKKNTTIDRIDSNKNYSKENCRWATRKEQNRNMKSNINYNEECAKDASFRLGGSKNLVANRIANKWRIEEAFTIPITTQRGIKIRS